MDKPKKKGRPPSNNPKVRMPGMLVNPEQLEAYKRAAEASGKNFSQWARDSLDNSAEEANEENS